MRREHLEHLLRAAGNILREGEIIVVGSQSILGTYDEDALSRYAVMSIEADLLPLSDPDQSKADEIDGVLGEGSLFHETHGFYAQGVGETTSTLPDGWRDRLVRYSNVNTNGVVGLCLDPHDLCTAKLAATPCTPERRSLAQSFLRAYRRRPA